jgi:RNA recognition motif-containing protein
VNWARRNCRLHIGNIDESVTEEALEAVFRVHGEIIETDTIIHRTGKGGNFGQIHFKNREDAQIARYAMSGFVLGSKALHVEWNQVPVKSSHRPFFKHQNYDIGPVLSIYVQFETIEVI